jgi:hypothetical protein
MIAHIKDYAELAVALASLASLVVHAVGVDETTWGKRVRAVSIDVIALFKKGGADASQER